MLDIKYIKIVYRHSEMISTRLVSREKTALTYIQHNTESLTNHNITLAGKCGVILQSIVRKK